MLKQVSYYRKSFFLYDDVNAKPALVANNEVMKSDIRYIYMGIVKGNSERNNRGRIVE